MWCRMKKHPTILMEINLLGDFVTIAIQNINAHVFHSGRHWYNFLRLSLRAYAYMRHAASFAGLL